jgi:hypothetical protein
MSAVRSRRSPRSPGPDHPNPCWSRDTTTGTSAAVAGRRLICSLAVRWSARRTGRDGALNDRASRRGAAPAAPDVRPAACSSTAGSKPHPPLRDRSGNSLPRRARPRGQARRSVDALRLVAGGARDSDRRSAFSQAWISSRSGVLGCRSAAGESFWLDPLVSRADPSTSNPAFADSPPPAGKAEPVTSSPYDRSCRC